MFQNGVWNSEAKHLVRRKCKYLQIEDFLSLMLTILTICRLRCNINVHPHDTRQSRSDTIKQHNKRHSVEI